MRKTVVVLDLVGYSSEARRLQQGLNSASAVQQLNEQIQGFVDSALANVGRPRKGTVISTTGDGAILGFDSIVDAHQFTDALYRVTAKHNHHITVETAKRWFRVGAATGDLAIKQRSDGDGEEWAGTSIADAVRLEEGATPGHLIVCEDT